MDRFRISAALEQAADYIESHGVESGGFGRPGSKVCMTAAIAIGLGVDPAELGRGAFFRPGLSPEAERVAEVVIGSGLLDLLPPPQAEPWERRRGRPSRISPRRSLLEVARWSDVPGRTAGQAARALRTAAFRVVPASAAGRWPVSRTRPATKTA